jgi:hypothetical protein
MVSSATTRHLEAGGRHGDQATSVVDLRNQIAVQVWLKQNRPMQSFSLLLRSDFIYDNLAIEVNVIHSAHLADVNRFVFLGSSCIYQADLRVVSPIIGDRRPLSLPLRLRPGCGSEFACAGARPGAPQFPQALPGFVGPNRDD